MSLYFAIQYRRINRWLKALGLYPWLVLSVLPLIFALFAYMVATKGIFPEWLMVGLSIWALSFFSSPKHHLTLRTLFKPGLYRQIKLIENLLIAFPFALSIAAISKTAILLIPICLAIAVSFINPKHDIITLKTPTPFSKKPFEFIVGFRKYWLFIFINYVLLIPAIYVDNYRLAAFTLLDFPLIILTFYSWHEHPYFINIFNCGPKKFLNIKIRTAIVQSLIFTLPILLIVICAFPDNWSYSIIFWLITWMYIMLFVAFKYATYPMSTHLPYLFGLALCTMLPPLVIIGLPFFYLKAVQKISLHVTH